MHSCEIPLNTERLHVPSNSLLCTYKYKDMNVLQHLTFFVLFSNYSGIFESCDGKIARASCLHSSIVICSLFPQISVCTENKESMFLSVHCLNKKIIEC